MKRLASLIGGVIAGVLMMGACLYALAWLWPRLAGLWAAPTATAVVAAVAAATDSARPTGTPPPVQTAAPDSLSLPTEESPFLRELGPKATLTPAAPRTGGAGSLPVTRLDLQSPYEAQGFDFQYARLGDGRDRWVAASPDGLALVEIVGAEAVEEVSVIVFGPIGPIRQDSEDAAKRTVYMLTLMNAVLPGWSEGAEWFGRELVNAARQPGPYESSITHDGVRVHFSVEVQLGSITLSFEPD